MSDTTTPLAKRIGRLAIFGVSLLVIILGGYIFYLSYINAVSLVFPGSESPGEVDFAEYGLEQVEEVTITTPDGLNLAGWFIPPAEDSDGASILFLHGHGGNRAVFLDTASFLVEDGYGMLMFDFRNHGDSEGDRTSMGIYELEDALAAHQFLISQPGVNPDQVAIYGLSMGGAVAIRTMARIPEARALLTVTAYTDMRTLAQDGVVIRTGFPPSPFAEFVLLLTNQLSGANLFEVNPLEDMVAVGERPYFMMHGTEDTTIPFSHAERLVEAAQGPTEFYVVEGAGHSNLIAMDPDEHERRIRAFLATHLRDGSVMNGWWVNLLFTES